MNDVLADFTKEQFTAQGKTRDIYRLGSGPAVIVIAEIPGITPNVAGIRPQGGGASGARRCCRISSESPAQPASVSTVLKSIGPACVSREFSVWALEEDEPGDRLAPRPCGARARTVRRTGRGRGRHVLHRRIRPGDDGRRHRRGPGVEPAVAAVPDLEATQGRHRDLGCRSGQGEGEGRRRRVRLGLRFTHDPFCFAARFETLRRELGDGFIAVELDSSAGQSPRTPEERPFGADRAPR